jgi:hypothetical protein
MDNFNFLDIEKEEKFLQEKLNNLKKIKEKKQIENLKPICKIVNNNKIYIEIKFEDYYNNYDNIKQYFQKYINEEYIFNREIAGRMYNSGNRYMHLNNYIKYEFFYKMVFIHKKLIEDSKIRYPKLYDFINSGNTCISNTYNPIKNVENKKFINFIIKELNERFKIDIFTFSDLLKNLNDIIFLYKICKEFNIKTRFPDVCLIIDN